MAAASIRLLCEDGRDSDFVESKTRERNIGLDDIYVDWMRRCASSCRWRDLALETFTPLESSVQGFVGTEEQSSNPLSTFLASAEAIVSCLIEPPPSYYESIADEPPSYDLTEDLAAVQPGYKQQDKPPAYEYVPKEATDGVGSMTAPSVDFDHTSNFRQAAGKKAKKAQKQADQAKWADGGGDEGNNDAGEGDQNGGEGDGSNNGDGGAGDGGGGGGGDDWNDWDTGNKKKKGKKAKEEEKKKQEEEEKKKQEEEVAGATNPLSWADDANGDVGDDWGGFTTTTKKDKKGKKGKAEPAAENINGISNFDSIDLNDDAPKLDLDFGATEKKDNEFGFSAWGSTGTSSWNTGNNWSFGNDTGTTDIADSFAKATTTDSGDNNTRSFGGNKKNKKKTTATNGFDFGDFGAVDEEKGEDPKAEDAQLGGADDWGTGFTTTGTKGKKDKKKGIFGDTSNDPDPSTIGTAIAEPEPAADDSRGTGWGTATTKGKKKGKKGEDEAPPPPPPVPAAPTETTTADDWGGFGTKKDKKKGKKITEVDEPAVTVVPEPEPEAEIGWGSFGKKDKKKGNKKEPEKIEEPVATTVPEPEPDLDFGWGTTKKEKKKGGKKEPEKHEEADITALPEPELDVGWGASKKDKKKGKKDDKNEELAATAIVPDAEPEAGAGWGVFGKKDKKKGGKMDVEKKEELTEIKQTDPEPKADDWLSFGAKTDKKKKQSIWDEPEKEEEKPANEETFEPDTTADTGWGVFGTKKDKGKKGKKDSLNEVPPPPPDPEPVAEDKPSLSRTGSKKEKKGKKSLGSEVNDDPVTAIDSKAATDAATSVAADDDWMSGWGGTDKKKDKKNKRNSLASSKGDDSLPPPPPVPAVPEVPDASSFDIWGSSTKKDKEKKGKKGKTAEPESDLLATQDPVETKEEPVEDDWAASTWGLSAKDKKKTEKEREKAKKEKEEKEKQEHEERELVEEEERLAKEKEEEEKAAKAKDKEKEKSTVKGKAGKKGKATTSPDVSKTKDLLADSVPNIAPTIEDDTWGSWGASKKDKKKGVKKDMEFDLPPPAPTPPAQGLTPEPEGEEEGDEWASFAPAKTTKGKKDTKKDSKLDELKASKKGAKDKQEVVGAEDEPKKKTEKEDTPAKAVKSFWGGMTATSASKSKIGKASEKAKEEAEAEAEIDLDPDEIVEIIEEPPKKSAKDKSGGKLSKTSTKDGDKASKSSDAKKSIVDDDAPTGKSKDGKSKGLSKDDDKKEDSFSSLWGSSKKTSGKKGDEAKNKIGKDDSTNQKASVNIGAWNEPEPTDLDDQAGAAQPSKSSKTAMSTAKTSKQSSVLQRVKELEKNRASETVPPAPPADPEPASKPDKKGASTKSKDLASGKTLSSKKKDLSPESVDKKKTSKESVPGSFPGEGEGEGMDDEFGDLVDSPPIEKRPTKESKKSVKSAKESKSSSKARDTPESKRPPTPPPEPKEDKPVKKERPRVVKAGGASSWGMWGAAAPAKDKKASASKDDADISSPKKEKSAAPGLSRSKSTKTATEKDKETVKSDPKSSDSDKPKKSESRPPKSRGPSFGGLFGGPPTRTKSVRRNSTATSGPKIGSRRPSIEVDATGLPSPPAEEPQAVTGKAAKLMGVSGSKLDRKASSKGKQKVSAAPDPYAIDSDDMVMVNGLDDPIINAPIPKKGKDKGSKSKTREAEPDPVSLGKALPDRTRSKRESKFESSKSKRQSKAFNEDEDVVMVDGSPSDDPDIADGPDDMQFITKPKGLQRSSTTSKKPESRMGGLFGAFRKSRQAGDSSDRPNSKGLMEEELAPRKRTVTGGDENAKRPRRDERRRSDNATSRAADGYVYDTGADGAGGTEAEDADARKEERRAKRADKDRAARESRDEALKYEAERRAKRRAAEKDKVKDEKERKARKAEEAEARAQEEKEARRAARRAKDEEQANRELEEDILKPRSKRRDTEKDPERSSRPGKPDRRRSHYDKNITTQVADEEDVRRVRRDERRPKTDRRKSAAPVHDYFDPRNGKRGANANNDPYGGGGNDHTASWVESLAKDSPEPPPVEPTIMEPAPDFRAGGADDLAADEDVRRTSHRKSKRSSRMYADPVADDQDDRRRRRESKREGIRSGEGSAEEERYRSPRRQSDLGGVKLGSGTKTFDGKTGQGKRSSWFQKIGGRI